MTAVQSTYQDIVLSVRDGLREQGFRGSDGSFYLRTETRDFVVGFRKDQYCTRNWIAFTINVGLGVHALYDRYPYPEKPKRPSIPKCHHVIRIGWFNSNLAERPLKRKRSRDNAVRDLWWTIESEGSKGQALQELSYLLFDVTLPELLSWQDRERFIAHLLATEPLPREYAAWIITALQTDQYIEPPDLRPCG